ncbi:EpsG family protein [Yersinia pseudotuberculosis]|uniref:EpsG family protein n=1 Tax=Yersinia pseudotuberculosis TaxID=633 RepID=UPI001A9DB054|nr:EpsG family protein [Yersinia pseudotuberculosis]MBO1550550.1 hypothetical protein [Yersinia pseudotuberculosis]MBO1570566.1 hypothetical protein [Yersinia pseudotuberculosis]MBO1585673.1 hypothetical protein [Yersinia pseudotuberculosis]MBO1634996.1 hypothetical protein [Yersinia pseudotuberculosis]
MIFYILATALLIISFFDLVFPNIRGVGYRYIYSCFLVFLAIFCGLRSNTVDYDYIEYVRIYNNIPSLFDLFSDGLKDIHGDALFFLISSLVKSLNLDVYVVFMVFAFSSIFIYRWCLLNFSVYPFLSIFIYFCHGFLNKEMTQIRAGLASAFILISLCFFCERKKTKSFITMILSFLSHSSALPVVLLNTCNFFLKEKHYRVIVLFFLSVGLFFIWEPLFNILPENISIVKNVNNYVYWDKYNYSLSLLNPVLLKQLFYVFIFIYMRDKYKWPSNMNIFIFSYVFSVCWLIAFSDMAILASRISNLFSVSELILVPYAIKTFFINKKPIFGLGLFFITIIINFAMLYNNLEIKKIFFDYQTIL